MIRHHAFFEALGAMDEQTPEWNAAFAGLSVLRLIDRAAGQGSVEKEWPEIDATRRGVNEVGAGDPARAILTRIVDAIESNSAVTEQVGIDLLSYGRALDMEARWPQAVDVFQVVAVVISARQHPRLVVEACTALGAAARSAGDWPTSNHAYARAEHLAAEIGDRELGLMVQIGLASSQMIQGNLPAADAELDEVFAKSGEGKFPGVEAKALHARASVAHCRGDYQRAVNLAYRSLELTTGGSDRERLLGDIAAAYAGLGMRRAARDGYTIVSVTSPHQWVRWQATLNLVELAIEDGDEQSFDDLMRQVEGTRLDPRLRTYYLYFRARGMRVFDRPGWEAEFAAAQHYAEAHHFNQLAHEIETARIAPPVLSAADGSSEPPVPAPTEELRRIAEVLEHLRETASA